MSEFRLHNISVGMYCFYIGRPSELWCPQGCIIWNDDLGSYLRQRIVKIIDGCEIHGRCPVCGQRDGTPTEGDWFRFRHPYDGARVCAPWIWLEPINVDPEEAQSYFFGSELGRTWAFPAGLVGVSLGLLALGRREAFLQLLPGRVRWRGELGALLLATLGMQLPLAVGLAWAAQQALPAPGTAAGVLLCDLHLASLALLALRWKVAAGVRAGAFVVLVGLVPGLLSGNELAWRLGVLVDPGRHLELFGGFGRGPAALSTLAAIAALLCASHRLAGPSTPGTASAPR